MQELSDSQDPAATAGEPLEREGESPGAAPAEKKATWCAALRAGLRGIAAFLTWLDLLVVVAVLILLKCISERWWLGTAITYMPRSPLLLPPLALLLATSLLRLKRASYLNLFALGLVAGPLMALHGSPLNALPERSFDPDEFRVVTCNVQGFLPDFSRVLKEIIEIDPHLIVLQEAPVLDETAKQYFADWHVDHIHEYFLASRFPLVTVPATFCEAYGRNNGVRTTVETPQGTIQVYNIHPTSPRHALSRLSLSSVWSGAGTQDVALETGQRDDESREIRKFVDAGEPGVPTLVLGDFNLASDSSIFRRHWGDLTDAFKAGGWGYGYTSSCGTSKRWPSNCPWLQVDHILTNSQWEVRRCWIGETDGSDHRLMAARLRLKAPR